MRTIQNALKEKKLKIPLGHYLMSDLHNLIYEQTDLNGANKPNLQQKKKNAAVKTRKPTL